MHRLVTFFWFAFISPSSSVGSSNLHQQNFVADSSESLKQIASDAEKNFSAAQNHQQAQEYEQAIALFVCSAKQFMQVARQIHKTDPLYATKQADRLAQALFAYEQAILSYQNKYGKKPIGQPYTQLIYSIRSQTLELMQAIDSQEFANQQLAQTIPAINSEDQRLQKYEQLKNQEFAQISANFHKKSELDQKILRQKQLQQDNQELMKKRKLKIGLWTSVGFALSSLSAGVTSVVITRKNGMLSNYIIIGAKLEGFPSTEVKDICPVRDQFKDPSVSVNCAHYSNLYWTSIAMWTTAGAFTVSTAILTGLILARKKHRSDEKNSRRHFELGMVPIGTTQGALVHGRLRF